MTPDDLAERLEGFAAAADGVSCPITAAYLRQAAQALRGMGEALEPFAQTAGHPTVPGLPDWYVIAEFGDGVEINVGHLRKARAARSALNDRGGE